MAWIQDLEQSNIRVPNMNYWMIFSREISTNHKIYANWKISETFHVTKSTMKNAPFPSTPAHLEIDWSWLTSCLRLVNTWRPSTSSFRGIIQRTLKLEPHCK